MKSNFIFLLMLAIFLPLGVAHSQEQERDTMQEMLERLKFRAPTVQLNQIPSLFFTSDEAALIASVRSGVIARPPTERELNEGDREEEVRPEPGIRELSLGGIVYKSSSDWTIWMNGQKITPDRIPPQVLDIRVRKDHIKLKWFDPYTNQIFPIKLKPHQRFNVDTRIFLPG